MFSCTLENRVEANIAEMCLVTARGVEEAVGVHEQSIAGLEPDVVLFVSALGEEAQRQILPARGAPLPQRSTATWGGGTPRLPSE